MIRVFMGYDVNEPVAFSVAAHAILRRASVPVSVTPVALSQLEGVLTRERVPNQSTDFSFSRFLVPWICEFTGWSIFMDCDQLCLDDIKKLWDLRDESKAVQVVKHDHRVKEGKKFLGKMQQNYPMKNWSSVMLMNNRMCWKLTPDYVNTATGLELHRFEWLKGADWDGKIEDMIGALPPGWNHLVGYDEAQCAFPGCECNFEDNLNHACILRTRTDQQISNLHFTEGGPWFPSFTDVPFADLWRRERNAAFSAASK